MKNNNSNIIKLEYLHHNDEIIGNNTERTILFTIPETSKPVKLKKNNILLKIIIKNFNSVSLLLKINNCFIDITEKNLSRKRGEFIFVSKNSSLILKKKINLIINNYNHFLKIAKTNKLNLLKNNNENKICEEIISKLKKL